MGDGDINECPVCLEEPLEYGNTSRNISWIQCSRCDQWFHVECLKLSSVEIKNLFSYHCQKCEKVAGPSVYKRRSKRARIEIDYVALNDGDSYAVSKSEHPHVSSFLQFDVEVDRTDKHNPHVYIEERIDEEFFFATRLDKPVLLPNVDDAEVGMVLPRRREEIDMDFITAEAGEDSAVEVMDVLTQQGVSPGWDLAKWRDYFLSDANDRDRIRNVISLEISETEALGKSFKRPQIVRRLDLVDKVWNDSKERPKVTKYCLMSVNGSFTDFHVDFSGTAVYYTVCSGEKVFLMYPPTDENLALYTEWCLKPDQNYVWFPDTSKRFRGVAKKPSNGFKVNLHPGDLFMIPSGWIHAVYTPSDSIVIGGNYLTLSDLQMHLKINDIEKQTNVPTKFRFPMFNKVLWLTSWYYFNHKDEFFSDLMGPLYNKNVKMEDKSNKKELESSIPYDTLKALIDKLKAHNELAKTNNKARNSIPTRLIQKPVSVFFDELDQWLNEIEQEKS
ncbi:Piso0_005834 [Millerozyma farinosa CBS 7064]|uniref:JmjC domain-containing histone demethylation protein 1 n=1 Tax=Pichia sorbitophila (strain ATCC MYA-4447 / BCRC 22081 / CBS 7064 / NBRC 10061 / NRRL Y-12695) TaxID=559304 RepID=G8Y028_PICSO|nr:Piso0_005834 [Millerozyma farinosa CBS 7064]